VKSATEFSAKGSTRCIWTKTGGGVSSFNAWLS
jgi:hypothetical protein